MKNSRSVISRSRWSAGVDGKPTSGEVRSSGCGCLDLDLVKYSEKYGSSRNEAIYTYVSIWFCILHVPNIFSDPDDDFHRLSSKPSQFLGLSFQTVRPIKIDPFNIHALQPWLPHTQHGKRSILEIRLVGSMPHMFNGFQIANFLRPWLAGQTNLRTSPEIPLTWDSRSRKIGGPLEFIRWCQPMSDHGP